MQEYEASAASSLEKLKDNHQVELAQFREEYP
jgi:hypothetical protein